LCARTAHETVGGGWYISMLDVLFSWCVFIHLSLHESTTKLLGIPNSRNEKWIYFMFSNNKFLGKCWYGRHPWIQLAMESQSMVEKGINFIFCLGTSYDIYSMESIGNYSIVFIDRKSMPPPKCFISIFFALSSDTSTNPYPPLRMAFLLLYASFIFTSVSFFSYKAPTKGHYDRTWALGAANMWVCFMNGSMIVHNGLGITRFSVDILKDMVACWYAWVLKSSCQN